MKNYNSIDLTKFILSIFVITIHCYIVPTIQQPLLRDICMMIQYTAVPLFFCFTGYFLFRRVLLAPEGAKKNIKRAWLRFGKLYLIWFIIYSVIIDGQGGGGGGVCVCVGGGGHPAFSSRSFRYFFMSKRNKNQKIKIKKFYDFLMTNA